MDPITTEATITSDHKLNLSIDLPKDYPIGKAKVTVTVEPQESAPAAVNRLAEIRGKYEGQIWMSEDFDEPLKDFAEYM